MLICWEMMGIFMHCFHRKIYYNIYIYKLGGGFKYVLFSPLFGEDFQFDSYFSDGLKPPTSKELG